MPLTPGTRLGAYEVTRALGVGGMGEVYRARDTRLDRSVAIKVMPADLTTDPQFRARFEREARAISQLQHPHICTLYDVGEADGTAYLVMELLQGQTLADRLTKGSLPVDEALKIAIDVADALSAAHKQGIIHRDLKPANIMLTKAGAKLLDFGLAKAVAPGVSIGADSTQQTASTHLTGSGTILGTFQYMAPEQVEGKDADTRTDIFAFGAVLYETIAGKKAFEGKSQASLIGAILHADPPLLIALQPLAPPSLARVVHKCLRKDPDERWQSARDLFDELTWTAETASTPASAPPRAQNRWRERAGWLAAVLIAVGALMYVAATHQPTASAGMRVVLSVNAPEKTSFSGPAFATIPVPMFALSPDGRSLVLAAAAPGATSTLWLRPINDATARMLPGSEDAQYPFWSPDGDWIAFFSQGKLKKMRSSGGPVQVILEGVVDPRGGSWGRDNTILIGNGTSAIVRTPSSAGVSVSVTHLDASREEAAHRWPVWLPDGRHFLFAVRSNSADNSGVYLGSLDEAPKRLPIRSDFSFAYAAPGYVLFLEGKTLVARTFDATRFELGAESIPVAEGVGKATNGLGAFSASENGALAYAGTLSRSGRLTWFDRDGNQSGSIEPDGEYVDLRLSPDDKRLAVSRTDPHTGLPDVWLRDLDRGDWSQFTFGPRMNAGPTWSPDGTQIIFRTTRAGGLPEFYQRSSGNAGSDARVLAHETVLAASGSLNFGSSDWSPDGQNLLYPTSTDSGTALWLLPLKDPRNPVRLLATGADNMHGAFSRRGDLVAYGSNESGGRFDVYVQTFPFSDRKWHVSTAGGYEPRWRADGHEIYYLSLDKKLMAVSVEPGPSFGVPRPLFQTKLADQEVTAQRIHYASTGDGTRFLINTQTGETTPTSITLVLNWRSALGGRESR
jgi:Tol biopolymer transport system component